MLCLYTCEYLYMYVFMNCYKHTHKDNNQGKGGYQLENETGKIEGFGRKGLGRKGGK